ncbi:lysine-sensitive aspartokinase 3 [Seminibacterium arietis]|uniref:Aspartokinase n=1 Tax=Seminibacterium arietis TaxID=1173502 RepID=A0ABW3I8Z6_9PAST
MLNFSVAKFGGTSVANHEAMTACANIVIADPDTRVVVLSASAGVTNLLVALANGQSSEERIRLLSEIRQIQENILSQLKDESQVRSEIEKILAHIAQLAEQATTNSTEELSDALISQGEMMSSLLFVQVLKELNVDAQWVDVRTVVATDSHFGKAMPNDEQTQIQSDALLAPLVQQGKLIVTQGFIGRDPQGRTTTLGRGGSDYSAALLAEVLKAKNVLIWTDVAGIYTTDPRIVPTAWRIDSMSFSEAAEMATFGAKVLHPSTLLPAVRSNLPVYVGSSKDPQAGGTWVTREPQQRPQFRAVALRRDQTLLTLSNPSMVHAQGFLAQIFQTIADHKISVDMVITSEASVALTLDKTGSASSGTELLSTELLAQLNEIAQVKVDTGLSLVTLIGNELHKSEGVVKTIFDTLESYSIRMISYGASTNSICMLVNSNQANAVVNTLHKNLFE